METEKTINQIEVMEPGASDVTEFKTMESVDIPGLDIESNLDQNLISELEEKISSKKDEIKNKVYAVTMSDDLFKKYENFINEDAEWAGTEALGIREINKQIQKIKKEGGIKNSVVFLGALPLEASHYFISKGKGRGLKSAEEFITLYKAFDQALGDAKTDAKEIRDLERDLSAAMQGISVE
jgi:hypothetical protein